jgi:GDP-4-dehydro-6-deoxy-D-mannose reductase
MSKLFIFGSGFLVRHIANEFTNNGDEAIVMYNNHKLEDYHGTQLTMKDSDIIECLIAHKPDYILFAKGDSFVCGNSNISTSIGNNVIPIAEVLDILNKNLDKLDFIKKIIVIGSAAEYTKKSSALHECEDITPTSVYGLSKIFLFNTAMYYFNKGLPIVYSRQFNAIGPYQRNQFVLSTFASQLVSVEGGAEPKLEVGDLSCERDFIDVRDAAYGYRLLFEHGVPGEVYNVGSGKSVKIKVLLDTILSKINYDGKIEIVTTKKNKLSKNSLTDRLLSDNTKLVQLGFEEKFTLEETIEDTLGYWRNVQK